MNVSNTFHYGAFTLYESNPGGNTIGENAVALDNGSGLNSLFVSSRPRRYDERRDLWNLIFPLNRCTMVADE